MRFEGEYLNGKRNGKGKEYYEDGNILFEGEYLNGERWNGYEKKYDTNSFCEGYLSCVIEYLNGKKTIKEKTYDWDGYCYNDDEFKEIKYEEWYGGRRCPRGRGKERGCPRGVGRERGCPRGRGRGRGDSDNDDD